MAKGGWGPWIERAIEAVRSALASSKDTKGSDGAASGTSGVAVAYKPKRNGRADPGEVVWAWVPFEEDPKQGKDRPVLIVGKIGRKFAAVQLSSQSHEGRRDENDWVAIGTGGWDRRGRLSYVDASRLLKLSARSVRREGGVLPRDRFDAVLARVEQIHGWHR